MDADQSTPTDPQPEPESAAKADHQDVPGEAAEPAALSQPGNLDFCFDPEYRAPAQSFAALEARLARVEVFDDERRVETTRLDLMERQLAKKLPELGGISLRGAIAAHSYSTHEVFGPINAASRSGELNTAKRKQLQAIVSGMNELPRVEGPLARGINSHGDLARRDLIAGHYEPGQITVETALTSCSMTDPDAPDAAIPGDIDLRIESKTARRLQELAMNPGEREAVLLPGSQLLVHSKELVSETTKSGQVVEKWIIHAEEIAPGDPRYLDRAEVDRRMEDRCERTRAEESSGTGSAQDQKEDAERPSEPSKIENALSADAPHAGAPALPDPDSGDPYGAPQLPSDANGLPDWKQLASSTPPVTELPSLHAGTAHPDHQAAYVADRHPELGEVNPNAGQPDAYDRGFLTNCTRCVVSYAQRLGGIDAQAEPVLPSELATKGRLDYIDRRLGGDWESHRSYDSIIERMSKEPVGSHAVIGVQYMNGPVPLGHVAMVTNTPDGVAFIDPQTGRLMTLPHPPRSLTLLPFGSLPQAGEGVGTSRAEPDGQRPDSDNRLETEADLRSDSREPEARPELAEVDDGDSRARRPDGPWFGQHTNPFRPSFPGEDEEEERPLPPAQPGFMPSAGTRPPGISPAGQHDNPAPNAGPEPMPVGQVPPAAPAARGSIEAPEISELPSLPATDGAGALNRSFNGTLDPSSPTNSAGPATTADLPRNPAGSTPSSSSPAAGQGAPASMPPLRDAPAGSAVPGETGAQPGSAGGSATSGGSAGSSGSEASGGLPGVGPGAGGARSRSDSDRRPWLAGATSGIIYEREQAIPADLAVKYLGNHEPTELLTGDGRQSLFRSTSLPDLGPVSFDEFSGVEQRMKLRCEVPSAANPGGLSEQGDLSGGEFIGSAEIVIEDLGGTERVLGTYDSNTQSWTPTPAGRSWLNTPGGNMSGHEQRRKP